jgi:recombination protein RecA
MPLASIVRTQVETALSQKIPSALTPAPKMIRPVAETGIESLDEVLKGGLPVGAISELVGPECSGRTSIALSFLARITQTGKVCAWIDVSDSLDPASASAAGVDLNRLLWVRCGALPKIVPQSKSHFALPNRYLVPPPVTKGLHGGGCGSHPRGETKGLSQAVSGLLQSESFTTRCAEPQRRLRQRQEHFESAYQQSSIQTPRVSPPSKPWSRIEQGLRATALLLQGDGFGAIVFDMGSLGPEFVSRVPLATWFRYRAAAERTQSSILLLTQHGCAKSSAELLLRLRPGRAICDEATVFSGIEPYVEVVRRRFAEDSVKVIPLRNPPQSATAASWQSRTTWAGRR